MKIKPWTGDPNDKCFRCLSSVFLRIAEQDPEDVREFLL